jgi:cytoskeletal protein RodZ
VSPVPTPPAPATAPRPAQPQNPPARTASGTAAQAPAPRRTPSAAPSAAAPAATAPAPAPAAPAPAAPAAAAPAANAGPTLDLASLEQRLRDTHAIGIFTKLSLKNQVDDLLAQFRTFYAGQDALTLAGLRRSYELLLMKVVTLLQGDDPGLATAVSSSREAIWAILSDRNKFNNL